MGLKHTCNVLHWPYSGPYWSMISRTGNSSVPIWEYSGNDYKVSGQNSWSCSTNHKNWAEAANTNLLLLTSRPWIFRHHLQVTELQSLVSRWSQHMPQQHILYRKSNHNIAVWTSNHQLSSLWKKNSAARPGGPGRTYFGKIFVINGEQSVVRELILWFCTCKIASATQADVNL